MSSSRIMLHVIAALLLALSLVARIRSAPTELALARREVDYAHLLPPEIETAALAPRVTVPVAAAADAAAPPDAAAVDKRDSAGLYWGPKDIGNLRLKLTNPHMGYAGPKFPMANHVNFHVEKKGARGQYTDIVNMHIVKYTRGGDQFCLYVWESHSGKTVFGSCFDDFAKAIPKAVGAIKDFVADLLHEADFFAAVIIIGALVVALAAVIASLGAVAVA